jgi:hypothetical protein
MTGTWLIGWGSPATALSSFEVISSNDSNSLPGMLTQSRYRISPLKEWIIQLGTGFLSSSSWRSHKLLCGYPIFAANTSLPTPQQSGIAPRIHTVPCRDPLNKSARLIWTMAGERAGGLPEFGGSLNLTMSPIPPIPNRAWTHLPSQSNRAAAHGSARLPGDEFGSIVGSKCCQLCRFCRFYRLTSIAPSIT